MLWKIVSRLSLLAAVACFAREEARTMEEGGVTSLIRAVEEGNTSVMDKMGIVCKQGQDVLEAVRDWYRKAATTVIPEDMYILAETLWNLGFRRNLRVAAYWYKKAAEAGWLEAICEWGLSLGAIVDLENQGTAICWYKKAADAGEMKLMSCLARYYQEGRRDVLKDEVEAAYLLQEIKAAEMSD